MNISPSGHVLRLCTNLPWLPIANQRKPTILSMAFKTCHELAQLSFLAQLLSSNTFPKPGTTAVQRHTPFLVLLPLLTPGPLLGILGRILGRDLE